jgi:cytochrome c553
MFDFPDNDVRMTRYVTNHASEIAKKMGAKVVVNEPRTRPFTVTTYQSTHNTGRTVPWKARHRYELLWATSGGVLGGWLTLRAASGDSQEGGRIVSQGTDRGAVACARCNGFDGAADGSGAFPDRAGQTAYYLAHQLHEYALGQRRNPIMESIAKGLTPDEMDSVAHYYANTNPPTIPRSPASPNLVARGRQIALVGDASARVQDCVTCHGRKGEEGEPPTVPYLAGQYKH